MTDASGASSPSAFRGLQRRLRAEPAFSGTLRQRLALKAAATCAPLARLREDEGGLRDAEHLGPAGAQPSSAGRLHRLFRLCATQPLRLEAATFAAAELLELQTPAASLQGLAAALQEILANAGSPLTATAGASRAARTVLPAAAARARPLAAS